MQKIKKYIFFNKNLKIFLENIIYISFQGILKKIKIDDCKIKITKKKDLFYNKIYLLNKQKLKKSNKHIARLIKSQKLLMEIACQITGTLNKAKLLKRLETLLKYKLGWTNFIIFWVNNQKKTPFLSIAIASGLLNSKKIANFTLNFGKYIILKAIEKSIPIVINDLSKESIIKSKKTTNKNAKLLQNGSILSVPMLYQDRVIGVMNFYKPQIKAFDNEDITLIYALCSQVAIAKVNADLYEATLALTTLDPLTGIMNRRGMHFKINATIKHHKRYLRTFALLMVDVDNFKDFNDRMGHIMGDIALIDIAKRLKSSIRKDDSVARFGGEEFCLILPQTNERQALEVAQKLCLIIQASTIRGASSQPLGYFSISIGIAIYPKNIPIFIEGISAIELISEADQALYAAKREGKNRIKLFKEYKKNKNSYSKTNFINNKINKM